MLSAASRGERAAGAPLCPSAQLWRGCPALLLPQGPWAGTELAEAWCAAGPVVEREQTRAPCNLQDPGGRLPSARAPAADKPAPGPQRPQAPAEQRCHRSPSCSFSKAHLTLEGSWCGTQRHALPDGPLQSEFLAAAARGRVGPGEGEEPASGFVAPGMGM